MAEPIIFTPIEWISKNEIPVRAYQTTHGATFLIDTKTLCIQITTSTCNSTIGGTRIVLSSSDWEGAIRDACCFGDSLYFRTDRMKIYKVAVSKHPRVEFIRDIKQDETRYKMLFSNVYEGIAVVYRAWEGPNEGIAVDIDADVLERYVPGAIHRGKIIYKSKRGHEKGGGLMVRALSPNIIAIDSPENYDCDLYTTEESPLIYLLTGKRELTVLNPHSMELLSYQMRERWMTPRMQSFSLAQADAPDLRFWDIVGVGKGGRARRIVVVGMDHNGHRLFAAEPPDARLTMLDHDAEKAEKQRSVNNEGHRKKIEEIGFPIVPF